MKKLSPARIGAFLLLLGAVGVAHAQDRKSPTTPSDFRVTSLTPGSATFAWNPSTDNSGSFNYVIVSSFGQTFQVPHTQTTATIWPNIPYTWMTYSFHLYAIDAAGNRSKNSNSVSVRFPNDVTPPSKPTVNVISLSPTHVGLSWSTTDDGVHLRYEVNVNGATRMSFIPATSANIYFLSPGQTYTLTVRARDSGGNWSPYSDPLLVTTPLPDPNDRTPPTPPQAVHDNGGPFQDGELWLFWSNATDNVTPQNLIRYDLSFNGVITDGTVNFNRFILYLELGRINTVEITAVDEAGNRSAPVTRVYDMR